MSSSRHIFRAYDVRGIFNQELTVEMAAKIGTAYGSYLDGQGRILIARDGRTSSEIMENAFISGLASTGCECTVAGLIPIPTANFHIWCGDYTAGAYITASHNPPEYNGVRFRHSDGTGYTRENQEVRDIYLAKEFHLAPWKELGKIGRLNSKEAVDAYLDFILRKFTIERGLKVVLDLGNGVSALSAPKAFERMSADVVTINDTIDGTFPGRPSEPSDKTLGELKKVVKREKADFGAGYDGDADRVIFVDDKGRMVQTEKIGIVIARDILGKKKGKIIANIECSMIVEKEIEKLGGEVLRVRVGDVFISEAIKKHKALFAMETSAHYFFPEFYTFDDPLLISLKLGEILSSSDKKLSEIADEIPSYPMRTANLPCRDEIKFKVMDRIAANWSRKGYSLDMTDGAKVLFEDGWALLRPSNTTPLIRASVEGENAARVAELLRMVKREFEGACE
ncbi:MAG: phosphoglucosamine mutase [Candidatus Hydrothermarchaeota archaeon]|nr:phosphoglucosamine mutase [Candidatus Hydrothermarchaeota archaeon]